MVKVSCILHYKCFFILKFLEISTFFPVVYILIVLEGVTSKYEVYFVGDNQLINRVQIGYLKMRNRGAFLGSLAALLFINQYNCMMSL